MKLNEADKGTLLILTITLAPLVLIELLAWGSYALHLYGWL